MEKISVIVDEKDNISSFTEGKYVKLFQKEDTWEVIKVIPIDASKLNGIKESRDYYTDIAKNLSDCKILIVTKASGVPYSIFYAEDFSVWELNGNPRDYFDNIIEKEAEHEIEVQKALEEEVVTKVQDGYYYLDLEKLELTNPELSSKKAIRPFMEKTEFEILEVHCCHVPPWLIEDNKANKVSMRIEKVSNKDYTLFIKGK